MADNTQIIILLAIATLTIRLSGALLTRSLILTMLVGIVAVWFLRFMG